MRQISRGRGVRKRLTAIETDGAKLKLFRHKEPILIDHDDGANQQADGADEPEHGAGLAKFLESIFVGKQQDVARAWAGKSPEEAIGWLATQPPGDTRTEALVIDDEEWILELVRQILQQDGFEVDTVQNGAGLYAAGCVTPANCQPAFCVPFVNTSVRLRTFLSSRQVPLRAFASVFSV